MYKKRIRLIALLLSLTMILFTGSMPNLKAAGEDVNSDVSYFSESGEETDPDASFLFELTEETDPDASSLFEFTEETDPDVSFLSEYTQNNWIRYPEGWYYVSASGTALTGWQYVDGLWYYLDAADPDYPGRMLADTKKVINGRTYFFHSDGSMATGWVLRPEGWYYTSADGDMLTGWIYTGNRWYYLNAANPEYPGLMLSNTWFLSNGIYYYLTGSGAMATGWLNYYGTWYYLSADGDMLTGWQQVNGDWYYLYKQNDPHGGSWGAMAASTTIDGWRISSSGNWVTPRATLNKILDTDTITFWDAEKSISTEGVENAIAAFHDQGYEVSFVLVDITSGQAVSYNACLWLYGASVIKGPYVISLLDAGYEPTNNMQNAISWSSNSDYETLRSTYGAEVFQNWLARANVDISQGSDYYTATTSLDLAKMWLLGWDLFSSSSANADWARSTFQSVWNSPISECLGGSYTVYSKAGWYPSTGYYSVYNDAGIVWKGSRPYVLALMSNYPGIGGAGMMKELIRQLDQVHSGLID